MFRFSLENGPSSRKKIECPHCHRRSFTRYVDNETGQYIDDSCGRCDHEQSCGYHLSPSVFFSQHPGFRHDTELHANPHRPRQPPKPRPLCTMPMDLVLKLHKSTSNFTCWMASLVEDKQQARHVWEEYLLGATYKREVIFWQIDTQQRVHGGKIMQYKTSGHRIGQPRWIHTSLKADGDLPQDWTLTQCLFGEHLLTKYPDKPVCIVESEKTAVCMAMFAPQYVWLATGGCNNLRITDLAILRGRRLILYPDAGEYVKWFQLALDSQSPHISVVSNLEDYPPNTDILDVYLQKREETNSASSKLTSATSKTPSASHNPPIAASELNASSNA